MNNTVKYISEYDYSYIKLNETHNIVNNTHAHSDMLEIVELESWPVEFL